MSKNSQEAHPFRVHEDVLISRAHLQKMRRRQALSAEARYSASKLIKDATEEAAQIRRQGFSDGYRDGVLASADALLAYLDGGRELARQLQEEIRDATRAMLRETLDRPEAILTVLEDWLHQHADSAGQQLQLKLPRSAQAWRMRVTALLETSWGRRVQVDYHDDPRFLLRCGNTVAEFDPVAVAAKGEYLLLRQLDQLPASCRRFSDDAMQTLHALFEQRFAAAAAAAAAATDGASAPSPTTSSENS